MNQIARAIILAAALALLPTGAVRGQAPADATGAKTLDGQAPAKPAAKRRVRSNADARACLDFANNLEVIACAEKYR